MASSTTRRAFCTTSSPLSGRLDGLLLRFGISQAWHGLQKPSRGEFQIDPLPNGQILLPLVELIEQARLAVDTVVEQIGRKTIETLLVLSAEQIAGPRTPGKVSGDTV